jgi:hypothetical protein
MVVTPRSSTFFTCVDLAVPSQSKKTNRLPLIIGASAGGAVLAVAVVVIVVFIARRKRTPKGTEDRSQSFGQY